MVAQPANALNQNSTVPGLYNWDGTATTSSTALLQYYTMVGSSANTVQNVAPGTAGWVLTSGGASAYPTYQAPVFTQVPWTDKAISFAAVSRNGYFVTANATATLPALPAQGDIISFAVSSVAGILTIQANTGQMIQIGKAISAAAGTAVSNFNGDSVTLVYQLATTTWLALGPVGTFTVT